MRLISIWIVSAEHKNLYKMIDRQKFEQYRNIIEKGNVLVIFSQWMMVMIFDKKTNFGGTIIKFITLVVSIGAQASQSEVI